MSVRHFSEQNCLSREQIFAGSSKPATGPGRVERRALRPGAGTALPHAKVTATPPLKIAAETAESKANHDSQRNHGEISSRNIYPAARSTIFITPAALYLTNPVIMQKKASTQSGLFHPRILTALSLCFSGLLIAALSIAAPPSKQMSSIAHRALSDNSVAASASATGPTSNLSDGITFDHGTWNDPVRMVGEPDIVIDPFNGIYVSGPGGSTTQASWFWKSTDKGLQWHLIGCPLKSNCQNGGGDTEIAIARNGDVFASDLQTLTCNSALRSYDQGATWLTSEGCFPGTDRQWMGVYDPNGNATGRRIYLTANGQTQGAYFLVSTDNGVTYVGTDPINNPTAVIDQTNGESAIGRFAINNTNGHIYVPGQGHTWVSTDGGVTFLGRPRPPGVADNIFATIVVDTAGNLWWGWINNANTQAFVSYSTNEGQTWSTPRQVSTGAGSPAGTSPDLHAVIMPWIVVGDPGRVAVVYYGTTNTGSSSVGPGDVNALWHVYASISTNAMDPNPTWTQVQADEHPMHRSTICTGGTGCVLSQTNGDRSMADFFAVDKDNDGRIYMAYNENSDLSLVVPAANEYIGKPINAAIRLRTGPSLYSAKGNLLPDPTPANVAITSASVNNGTITVQGTHGLPPGNWASDPAGDAPYPVIPVASANHPAMDILETSVTDNGTDLTVKLKMADLSPTALADAATTGGNPSWLVTWFQAKGGVGPAAMTSGPPYSHKFVKWLGGTSFSYGTVSSVNSAALGAPTPKTLTYVPDGLANGVVNGNEVTITVPLSGFGLVPGDKIDHIIAYSMVEHADITLNDWADQVKSFSYVIGTPAANQHFPDGYVQISTDGFATSTVANLNSANNTWNVSIPTTAKSGVVCARQVLAKDLYTPLWDDVQAGPAVCTNFNAPMTVVSRKIHGAAGAFDIDLPPNGTAGVECRAPGSNGTFTLVYTFSANVTAPGVATKTQGTGLAGVATIGPNLNQVTVPLRSVTDSQHLVVDLSGVQAGGLFNNQIARMDVLLADTNSDLNVDGTDVSQTKAQSGKAASTVGSVFREDVNFDGFVDGTDVSFVKSRSGAHLP